MYTNEDHTTIDNIEKSVIWDNSQRAKTATIVFCFALGLALVSIVSGHMELDLLRQMQEGYEPDEDTLNMNDLRQGGIGIFQFIIHIIAIVTFLNWFRRAYGNLHRLSYGSLKHKESMAVWAWFIPIISLFRPVQIMNEIWDKTQQKIREYDTFYVKREGGLLIAAWWFFFIATNIIGNIAARQAFSESYTIEEYIASSQVFLYSEYLDIPGLILVILVINQVSKLEALMAEKVVHVE